MCQKEWHVLMEMLQYFHDNLLEAIEGTPMQNSSIGRECASSQLRAGTNLNWECLSKTESSHISELGNFCNLWLKFQAFTCQCLM